MTAFSLHHCHLIRPTSIIVFSSATAREKKMDKKQTENRKLKVYMKVRERKETEQGKKLRSKMGGEGDGQGVHKYIKQQTKCGRRT
jgi:hypothetical protein